MASYVESIKPLDEEDREIIQKCSRERFGFHGDRISAQLKAYGISPADLEDVVDGLDARDIPIYLTREEARPLFALCALVYAAAGEEEAELLTGFPESRLWLTCRRLYMRSHKK